MVECSIIKAAADIVHVQKLDEISPEIVEFPECIKIFHGRIYVERGKERGELEVEIMLDAAGITTSYRI